MYRIFPGNQLIRHYFLERQGILGGTAPFVIVEIAVNGFPLLAPGGKRSGPTRQCLGIIIARVGFRPGTVEANVNVVSGHSFFGGALLEIKDTKGSPILGQGVIDFGAMPGAIAEFKAVVVAGRQHLKELFQTLPVTVPVGGELKQDGSEVVLQCHDPFHEPGDRFLGVFQLFIVGDVAAGLDRKTKVIRDQRSPVGKGFRLWKLIKGMVNFQGFELLSIVGEPVVPGHIGGIKTRSPLWIVPPGGANENTVGKLHGTNNAQDGSYNTLRVMPLE